MRSRRFATHQTEITHNLITFRLRQEWFALPIQAVQKVIPMGKVYGDPKRTGISLTLYQNQELLVVDVSHRIFGETPISDAKNLFYPSHERYLLIIENANEELVGLPIDSSPAIRRVPESAFTPLPKAYLATGNIQCISSQMVQIPDQPPLFLLNAEVLKVF